MSSPPEILVAVDLADGHVVRLTRGEMGSRIVYGDDPGAVAAEWEQRGARWLHVVDLDAAIRGEPVNRSAVQSILAEVQIPVQVAGGIRSMPQVADWAKRGATRICIGTRSLDKDFLAEAVEEFGDLIVASVDARGGEVRIAGWQQATGKPLVETVRRIAAAGVARIMFTAIERDGTLGGPDLAATETVLGAVKVPVIASGGVTTAEDVRRLAGLAPRGLEGIVVGKALYSGTLSLEDAVRAAEEPVPANSLPTKGA